MTSVLNLYELARTLHRREYSYASCSSVRNANDKREEEEPPRLGILESLDKLIAVPFLGLGGFLVLLRAECHQLAFSRSQELRGERRVGEIEPSDDGPSHGDEAKEEEEKLTGSVRSFNAISVWI